MAHFAITRIAGSYPIAPLRTPPAHYLRDAGPGSLFDRVNDSLTTFAHGWVRALIQNGNLMRVIRIMESFRAGARIVPPRGRTEACL